MSKIAIAAALLALVTLSSCANTAAGMTKDAKATGQAIGSSTDKVLKAGAAGQAQ